MTAERLRRLITRLTTPRAVVVALAGVAMGLGVWVGGADGSGDQQAADVVVAAPGGEASDEQEAAPTPSPTPTATATPSPTPAPTPWRVTFPTPTPTPTPRAAAPAPPQVYVGVVAKLGLDQIVAEAAAPAPPAVPAGTNPLTGVPATGSIGRAAMLVKLDNVAVARPQEGVGSAEIVYEEMVEGGLTRLAAVFLERGTGLGPVRSGRTTDIGLAANLNTPLFAYSGANTPTEALLATAAIVNRGPARAAYHRSGSRRAPHDLMTDAGSIRSGTGGVAPPTMFVFTTDPPAGGTPTPSFSVGFPATSVTWSWDGTGWLRSQDGASHLDALSGAQVRATTVIVQRTRYIDSGLGTPEGVTVGTGAATVYTNGVAVAATWTRPSLRSVTTYTDAAGAHIPVRPGNTWIELLPE